jgi:hypothetical protein
MKEVVLFFPDVFKAVNFLYNNRIVDIEIEKNLLKGHLLDAHITIACTRYGAEVIKPTGYQWQETFSSN